MAELEAITTLSPTADDRRKNPDAKTEVITQRFPLVANAPLTIGRVAGRANLVVPEDGMISSTPHATLTWDGSTLTVVERAPPHRNRLRVDGKEAARCDLRPGQGFRIGQTEFVLRGDGEGVPENPAEGTMFWVAPSDAPTVPFANPAVVLAALAKLSQDLRARPNEQARVRLMLERAVDALPRSDVAGLVFVPPSSTPAKPTVSVLESHTRRTGGLGEQAKSPFAPSRKLVHQALGQKKSLLYVWQTDVAAAEDAATATLPAGGRAPGSTPWAVCVPINDGSRTALYVSGQLLHGETPTQKAVAEELAGYQKVADLMAGLMEVTRQKYRLAEEMVRFWPFVPMPIREYLTDANRAELINNPREAEVVVLFCDLRNFTKYLVQQNKPLVDRWREVAFHLHLMSTAVTVHGGVVCRVLGDAIMGFWGWPGAADPDADRLNAAKAAAQIRSGIAWFNQLGCGVGVACGTALVGKLGTEHLSEIDLYGPVVNLASRLQDMTKAFGVGVAVSGEVADRLKRGGPFQTRRLGRVRPKGMEEYPCEVHELRSEDPLRGHDWSYWDGLVDEFTAGRWDGVYDQLKDYPDLNDPGKIDPAARCLMREMDRHQRRPPKGWDGGFAPSPPPADDARK